MSSMSKDRMLELMAYADGELEGAERAEVEAWLAKDAEAARFTNDIANLGELLKLGHEGSARAKAVESFDIADAVMAKIASGPADAKNDASDRRADERPASVVSLDEARRQRSLKIGAAVAAALALAASVFLVQRSKEEQPMAQAPAVPAQHAAPSTSGTGIDVDVVETDGPSVSVFYVPIEGMATTTTSVVVWVDETGGQ